MNDFNNKVKGLTSKKATQIPVTAQTQRRGKYSVNIVCAQGNRKSITLSMALSDQLALSEDVYITLYGDDGCIVLSPAPISEYSVKCSFSNEKSRIIYNSTLVHFIAETFELDYTIRTSMSFSQVLFDTMSGISVAVVMLREPVPSSDIVAEGQVSDYDG